MSHDTKIVACDKYVTVTSKQKILVCLNSKS